jgi:hypothetical protein
VIHDVSGGVARGVDDTANEASDFQFLAVLDVVVRFARGDFKGDAEGLTRGCGKLGFVELVHEDFGGGEFFGNDGVVGDVIEMSVREPEADEVPAATFGFFQQQRGGVVGGVEEDGFAGGFVDDEVAVGFGDSAGVCEDLH